jgi:Predicted hydrolase of the alpha/beta superfamily
MWRFITSTLKPYIDANYRTMPGRLGTAIAGSSMGGLISMYALAERQDVFSKAGVFSPAFWFSKGQAAVHVSAHPKQGSARVYFLAGADEENDGSASNYVVEDMQAVANAMSAAGFGPSERAFNVVSDGKHSEWFWRREFPSAYQWLFANLSTSVATADVPNLEIFPNPSSTWVRFSGFDADADMQVQVYGADGKLWQDTVLRPSQPLWAGDLPHGFYFVKARTVGGAEWAVARLVRAK